MRPQSTIVQRGLLRCLQAAVVLVPLVVARLGAAQDTAAPPPAEDTGNVVTRTASGGYTIDAFETNVVQVLTEVGDQAGFTVQAPDNFNSPLTLSAEDLPLDQLLRRVLRNENYIIVYRGGVQKTAISGDDIDKIFLLSQASSGPAPRAAAGTSPLAGPGAKPPPRTAPGAEAAAAGGEGFAADLATRAARARERAAARRAAEGEAMPPAPPGPAPAAPAAPDAPAHMVEAPEDFTPPPIDAPHVPSPEEEQLAGEMPPEAAIDGEHEAVEPDPDEY